MAASQAVDEAFLAAQARRLLAAAGDGMPKRYVAGIAGIGGSGKSTLAAMLHAACERLEPGAAAIVALDGFHLPNTELARRGLAHVKGSPETFNVQGFIRLLGRARAGQADLAVPVYDRTVHDPVWPPDARLGPEVRLLIVEGNYLLLDEPPWHPLADMLDECWLLAVEPEQARTWIIARHQRGGRSGVEAEAHYARSDGPNANRILTHMRPADLTIHWPV